MKRNDIILIGSIIVFFAVSVVLSTPYDNTYDTQEPTYVEVPTPTPTTTNEPVNTKVNKAGEFIIHDVYNDVDPSGVMFGYIDADCPNASESKAYELARKGVRVVNKKGLANDYIVANLWDSETGEFYSVTVRC